VRISAKLKLTVPYYGALDRHDLAKIVDCRLADLAGDMRRTVYITGDPDTYFSIPAVCKIMGCRVKGYVTGDDDGNLVFHHVYYS
jgi:hypothetical protein